MKNKLIYLFYLLISLQTISAQDSLFNLKLANCQVFKGSLFVFGITESASFKTLQVIKFNDTFSQSQNFISVLDAGSTTNLLQLHSDTLHNCLSIYLHSKDNNKVSLFRFDENLKPLVNLADIDVARLNNSSLFSQESHFDKEWVYSVKTVKDSSGKQFYLNKYKLKSEIENFDYEFKWQFPFERKNVFAAHPFFANKRFVFMYVIVAEGTKKGQWILKLNALSGQLLKASKLNEKADLSTYNFGNFYFDAAKNSMLLVGQKLTEKQFQQTENKLFIANAPFANLYYIELDSSGEFINRQEFKMPINDIKSGSKNKPGSFLFRTERLVKKPDGKMELELDVYKSAENPLCYYYVNTSLINLLPHEDKFQLDKCSITNNGLIEDFYFSKDPLDMNGKLFVDTLNPLHTFYYRVINFKVKQDFALSPELNPQWILSKSSVKKNNMTFSFLKIDPLSKKYQLSPIEEIPKSQNPKFQVFGEGKFIISKQVEESKFEIKLLKW